MIPLATEFKLKIDQRRLVINASNGTANPELTRAVLFGLLNAIEEALQQALTSPNFTGTSVQVAVDPLILANPDAPRIRNLLVALGYSVSLANGIATISW